MTGEEVISAVKAKTDTVLMSFSCGKDALCAWLAIRPHFARIAPFYMYLVPGLEFVEKSLSYYEDFFGCQIHRVPHPSLYRMLNNFVFQAPENCRIIEQCEFTNPSYDDISQLLIEDLKLPANTFTASGVRAADSPIRHAAIKKYGAINWKRKTFWPVWDWRKARLLEAIHAAQVKLPCDYRMFGRSFDGIDYRFLKPIRDNFPADYRRILEFFPLAEVELKRREYAAL